MTTSRRSEIANSSARSGFTLMELLAVMAIMFILMGMALAGFFGIFRGKAIEGAQNNIRDVLGLARQHAVTHKMRTYVIFQQNGTNASYLVCAQAGVHDPTYGVSPTLVVGGPRWEPNALVGGRVYNLTDGSYADITANGTKDIAGVLKGGTANKWNNNDRYGWAIHDAEYLPSTLLFDGPGPDGEPETVVFLPDGTTEKGGSGDYDIDFKEIVGPAKIHLVVRGLTGFVE